MIVVQVTLTCGDDYVVRREPHRKAHIERLQGLRAVGAVIGGGPAPDGRTADLVYRLQRPEQLKPVIEEDPYWTSGAWTGYASRSFSHFVEPWELPPVVLDGSRPATIVEGPCTDAAMGEFVLIELRGAGRMAFGGFLDGGRSWALCRTADGNAATAWFRESGFWAADSLTARPLLHVL
jgi:uncharacterized protein YciI